MKVSIIGAGIGGCATAYYLSKQIPECEIYIIERNSQPGGRIKTVTIDSLNFGKLTIDVGAGFIHEINKLAMKLIKQFKLPIKEMTTSSFGVWDGDDFVFKTSKHQTITIIKILIKYGFSLKKLSRLAQNLNNSMKKIYNLQEPFKSIDELLEQIEVSSLARKNCHELFSENKLSHKLQRHLIEPGLCNFSGQGLEINAFAGLGAAIALTSPGAKTISGGLIKLVEKLIENSNASLYISHQVKKISKINDGSYELEIIEKNGRTSLKSDIIVIAAPLTTANIIYPRFHKSLVKTTNDAAFITLVEGKINPAYFKKKKISQIPSFILTTREKTQYFRSLETRWQNQEEIGLHYINSREKLTKSLLSKIFSEYQIQHVQHWQYWVPDLRPLTRFDPIIIDRNMYYLSSLDSVITSIESSLIMARNIASLIVKNNKTNG